ncbi:MAG: HAMP domain-containing histidine kinase [Porphyromonas sp.]|nr:HAMP domain-containing histidine kinase [Porphyromonas sp.]
MDNKTLWEQLTGWTYGVVGWINQYSAVRIVVIIVAIFFAVVSLVISDRLVSQMAEEERHKMELWAAATQSVTSNDYEESLLFASRIIESNTTIPMIQVNARGEIINYNNIDLPRTDPSRYLYQKLKEFRAGYPPIEIDYGLGKEYLYYSDSTTLKQLLLFPYVQVAVFLIILGVSVLAIVSLKRADQNFIWEGMSRETAHQLGTPISSLMAWRELLMAQAVDPMVVQEMGKDIQRLEMIADRFQKIGSSPKLESCDLGVLVMKAVAYLQPRISKGVSISVLDEPEEAVYVLASEQLIAWVFENLIKNAVDAMQSKGAISIRYGAGEEHAFIEIQDTGKGLPRAQWEKIFRPGYTTRQRGWGLGLSLARRIVQDYHKGRIYVRHSELGVGTTFRILLTLAPSLPLSKDK